MCCAECVELSLKPQRVTSRSHRFQFLVSRRFQAIQIFAERGAGSVDALYLALSWELGTYGAWISFSLPWTEASSPREPWGREGLAARETLAKKRAL